MTASKHPKQSPPMSPAEYGRRLAASAPPLTPEQVEGAVRILATVQPDEDDQDRGGR